MQKYIAKAMTVGTRSAQIAPELGLARDSYLNWPKMDGEVKDCSGCA
jgi:hypothetical protein